MKNTYSLFFLSLILIVLTRYSSQAQQLQAQQEQAAYLNWFDKQVGLENTVLYEGIVYREMYRTINDKVKFYKTGEWLSGSVVYAGQLFSNLRLKYDVFEDQLLIKKLDRLGGGPMLLFKDKVSSFIIDGTEFVNINNPKIDRSFNGYFELLWSNDIRLLAKHRKNDFIRKDRSASYYEFIDRDKEYMLEVGNNHYPINKKRDLQQLFPDLKKDIDSFYQKNKRLRSRDIDAFMISLVQTLEDQMNRGTIRPEP